MRAPSTNLATLVAAARAGDRRALDELITAHLPFVYTIVRRALDGHPDADDVVQETMLRALRELRGLRAPESFRAWLAAIAVRQISTHLHRRRRADARTVTLDDLVGTPDAGANFADMTMLRLELSAQRRQVMRASGWLDPGDRALLSLWWLEVAGQLTRAELAAAIGVSSVHAGVRVQRMRDQLDLARSLVAAIDARPRCARLNALLAAWDRRPGPLWRKRLTRHIRSCATCANANAGAVPAERLVGSALLAVPAALTAGLLGQTTLGAALSGSGASATAGFASQLAQAALAHPVAAAVAAGALVAGAAATTANWPAPPPPAPTVIAAPASAQPLAAGHASLESANQAGFYVSTTNTFGFLQQVGPSSDRPTRQAATFEVVPGLANPSCLSFRLPDGRYLRHSSWRLRVYPNNGTTLFRGDATFCVRAGTTAGSFTLESSNYPGAFLRHRGNELWVDFSDGSAAFRADSSFSTRPPLGS